jgi:RNA polymerase sigma-70 factor (ECF subfamily)
MEKLLQTKRFLDEISRSVKAILLKNFPGIAGPEREDIEQEIKLKLWKMVRRGKDIRNLKSYLGRMVYTSALDVIAKRGNLVSLDNLPVESRSAALGDDRGPGPEALAERSQMRDRIRAVMDGLPERRRAVLELHMTGQDIEQMAGRLGWSSHRVRHLLYRGLGDVRKKLEGGRIESKAGERK